jgi:hypothetical protein
MTLEMLADNLIICDLLMENRGRCELTTLTATTMAQRLSSGVRKQLATAGLYPARGPTLIVLYRTQARF